MHFHPWGQPTDEWRRADWMPTTDGALDGACQMVGTDPGGPLDFCPKPVTVATTPV